MTDLLRPFASASTAIRPAPLGGARPGTLRRHHRGWQPCLYVDRMLKYRHIVSDMSMASTYRTEPAEQDEEFHGIQSRTGLQRFAAAASSG